MMTAMRKYGMTQHRLVVSFIHSIASSKSDLMAVPHPDPDIGALRGRRSAAAQKDLTYRSVTENVWGLRGL